MISEPDFLRKAVYRTVETKDRHILARVMVNSTHIRNSVYSLVRNEGLDADRTALSAILRRIASRIQDIDDPALERLSEAEGTDEFQHALGKFLRDTIRQVMRPPAWPALASSVAEEIAGLLLAADLDGDVVKHLAEIRTSASGCLVSLAIQ